LNKSNYITKGWREQGIDVRHEGNEVLALLKDGQVIARFSQTGVEIDNILKEIEAGKYGN
jgi:hypothetical protein